MIFINNLQRDRCQIVIILFHLLFNFNLIFIVLFGKELDINDSLKVYHL